MNMDYKRTVLEINMTERLNRTTILDNTADVPFIRYSFFENMDFMSAGFSVRQGGVSSGCYSGMNLSFGRGDDDENVHENFRRLGAAAGFMPEELVLPHQLHTTNVRKVTASERGCGIIFPRPEEAVDGQVTDEPGVVLIAYGADCVPVYFCDPVRKAVGICHAGWRGSLNDIPGETVALMESAYGCRRSDIFALIGPSICRDCYETGPEVAEAFTERFGHDAERERLILKKAENSDRFYLDLWEVNRLNLLDAGILSGHIGISGYCTKCHHDMLFSHRYHGDARGTNAGFIFIKNKVTETGKDA